MRLFWAVALGAAVGGVSRFYLNAFIQNRVSGDFPLGTLMINITGSLILGFILRYSLQSGAVSEEVRLLLTTGFCGGYTTFSTFSYDTLMLIQDREYGRASAYVAASVFVSLLAVFAGYAAANFIMAMRSNS